MKDATGQSLAYVYVTDHNEAVLPDLLLQPGSPHYTPCTTPHRLMGWGTFRADGRALQIDTDIVLALSFQTPGYILRLWTLCTPLSRSLPLTATLTSSAIARDAA